MTYKNLIVSPEFPNGKVKNYTKKQIEECKAVKIEEDARWEQEKLDKITKEENKESGKQKLKDLGLNDDEIDALVN